MIKFAIIVALLTVVLADDATDVLTCDFRRTWCQWIPDPQHWQLTYLNDTFFYAMLTDVPDGSLKTPSFTTRSPICFRFKYNLEAIRLPVSLTISSSTGGKLFHKMSTEPLPYPKWVGGRVTIPAGSDQVLTVKAEKTVDEENVFVAKFTAKSGAC